MNIRINTEDLEINIDGTIVFYIPTGNEKELNNSYNPINFIKKSSECTKDNIPQAIVAFLLFYLADENYGHT